MSQYNASIDYLTKKLEQFLAERGNRVPISIEDKQATYTQSSDYLSYCTNYHFGSDFASFILKLAECIPQDASIIEVGCNSGFTGLTLSRLSGHNNITFHDFAGLGLEFIGWYANEEALPTLQTVPYTNPLKARYDWVLCTDALEHTGNHLGTLKWLASLADNVALCYPLAEYRPPYCNVMDEWVDDEAIQYLLNKRYTVLHSEIADGRRYFIYRTKNG